jgi:hypothetical protein
LVSRERLELARRIVFGAQSVGRNSESVFRQICHSAQSANAIAPYALEKIKPATEKELAELDRAFGKETSKLCELVAQYARKDGLYDGY